MILLLLIGSLCLQAEEVLYEMPVKKVKTKYQQKKEDIVQPKQTKKRKVNPVGGNLPAEYFVATDTFKKSYLVSISYPNEKSSRTLKGVYPGKKLLAKINHSIVAFPDEESPLVATIIDSQYNGAKLLGFSKLEPNSKRAIITFTHITVDDETFEFKASAVTLSGQQGFEGIHRSQETTYFAADFLSTMTAAYFDGLVPRHQTPYGQVLEDNSPDSAFKKGLKEGALSTAERFREKLKKVPEFTEVVGPFRVQVLIKDIAKSVH